MVVRVSSACLVLASLASFGGCSKDEGDVAGDGDDTGDGGVAGDGDGAMGGVPLEGFGGETSGDGDGTGAMSSGGMEGMAGANGSGGGDPDPPLDPCAAILAEQDFCNTLGDLRYTTNQILNAGCHVFNDLDVAATVTVQTDPVAGPTVLIADNVNIRMGGDFNASGQGYAANEGPGKGEASPPYGAGAGHGGKGADRGALKGGITYGDPKYPIMAGSGGGDGGKGGGAILICAREHMTVDGNILANGANSGPTGAGAGGSILLIAPSMSGSGTLEANGGTAANSVCGGTGASGGGGRIAVLTDDDQFTSVGSGTATLSVVGGSSCSNPAGNGSQYVSTLPE